MSNILSSTAVRSFSRDTSGTTGMIFALAVAPILLMTGVAVDYSRAASLKAQVQSAADYVALALAHAPRATSDAKLQKYGEDYFKAALGPNGTNVQIKVIRNAKDITVQAYSAMPTGFMKLARIESIDVGAQSVSTYGLRKIEVALVLDNTGSMGQAGKLPALKTAVNKLLDGLASIPADPGDIKVSLVPFNTQVRIDTKFSTASWIRFDQTLENNNLSPLLRMAPTPATWTGCLSDRNQDYDISSVPSTGGNSRYVASTCQSPTMAPVQTLTPNLSSIRNAVNNMVATGATNVNIGLETGLATLRADHPLGTIASTTPSTEKIVILLTDGNNTMSRFGGNGAEGNGYVATIDDRLTRGCAAARNGATAGVQIYTVRVIDGNEPILRNCATRPSMYYSASQASDIVSVFDKILNSIQGVRLTM